MRDPCDTSGWRIEGCQSTEYQEEYEALYCAHCNRTITEQTEPNVDGGDITTEDYHTFYQYGKFAAYVPDDVDWQPVLRMHMELTSYYPSVWHCSDHGNWTLLNAQEDAA
jgi:hypothetical protein